MTSRPRPICWLRDWWHADRCSNCRRRIHGNSLNVTVSGMFGPIPIHIVDLYHANKRSCRVASRTDHSTDNTIHPPTSAFELSVEALGAALIGADDVLMPRWLRALPDRWFTNHRRDAAIRIGGMVERTLEVLARQPVATAAEPEAAGDD